jgi:hypothetical protein
VRWRSIVLSLGVALVGGALPVQGASAADCTSPAVSTISLASAHLYAGDTTKGSVRLSCAPARKTTVTLAVGQTNVLTLPAAATVRPGKLSATFQAAALTVPNRMETSVTATTAGGSVSTPVTVDPGMKSFDAEPYQVGGRGLGLTISLSGLAPQEGIPATVTSSSPLVKVRSPVTVKGLGLAFSAETLPVEANTDVTLTAALGQTRKSVTVTLAPAPFDPGSWDLSGPYGLVGGQTANYTVTISNPAPEGGLKVDLTDENHVPQVHLPSEVTIPAGQTEAGFPVSVDEDVPSTYFMSGPSITASIYDAGEHTIQPGLYPKLLGVTGAPDVIEGGTSFDVTVTFKSAFDDEGLSFTTSVDNDVLKVDEADDWGNVTGDRGSATVTFTVTTSPVTADTPAQLTITYLDTVITLPVTVTAPAG